jgi:pyridoxamine 5'-phosphate oxidase
MVSPRDLRREYEGAPLKRSDLHPDPIQQFQTWFEEAIASGTTDPSAMVLATADDQGRPSARTVLLKHFDQQGFVFFTCYDSLKGQELSENPVASLLFYWAILSRQVRISGKVERVSGEDSREYFDSRPRRSRLAALVSRQSRVLENRALLEKRLASAEKEFEGREIPLPQNWGGYRLCPRRIEFWQGHKDRLHDRFLYTAEESAWQIGRLFP